MKHIHSIIISVLITLYSISSASIIVKGNNTTTSPYGFSSVITTHLLDPSSGIFYVGLSGSGDAYNLSKAGRYNGQPSPSFTGFAPSDLRDDSINYLALSTAAGQTAADIVGSDASSANTVFILENDGSKFSRTTTLNDSNGAIADLVSGIAANGNYIVAAVNANASGSWGTAGSGLALVQINNDLSLTPKNAQTGTNGNLAEQLDSTSFQFTLGGNAVTMNATTPHIIWDQQLGLFYVGISMSTAAIAGSYALAIAKAFVNPPNNELELGIILPTAAAINSANQQIVVAQSTGSAVPLVVNKLAIMHASTGPTYLIVAGGNTANSNSIYALPLVDDPTDMDIHGTLANFNSTLNNGAFTTAATTDTELLNLNNASDAIIATVGATALPMSVNANLSDMVVVGDTVYASISATSSDNDPGIFYSQALFNAEGKINGWTPWTKKVIPTNAFPNVLMPDSLAFNGTIAFFQVDLVNGKIWYVDNQTKRVVGSTSWTSATYAPSGSLAYELDNALPTGVTVALDLDQGTRGFTDPNTGKGTLARYALFGGNGLVVFARTSVVDDLPSSLNSVQTAQTDFTNSKNFLVTKLPKNAGLVQTLEYSRQLADVANGNYFFAGTSNGLYAFADSSQAGFTLTPGNVNALDQAPFNGQWFNIPAITGSVIAIRTSGNALYVLTQQAIPTLQSTIYKIPFTANLSTMFASSNITMIAQTGNTIAPNSGLYTNFKNTAVFNDIAITFLDIATPTQEQLVIAASDGIYCSEATTGINNATSSNDAQWFSIDISKNGLPFLGIATVDNAAVGTNNTAPASIFPTTQWPFTLTNFLNHRIFNTGTIYQLGSYDSDPIQPNPDFVPLIFTSINGDADFSTLNAIINFNTDGARRFFVLNMDRNNRLMSLPFDVETWNVANQTYALVNDAQLEDIHAIYWIRPIGVTGTIFMGTNKGVYTLN